MDNYSEFGLKVRTELLKRRMTMTALAKELGITSVYLADILRGVRGQRKGAEYHERISKILGIS
jgi:transcriptional regulator with XRE-family HTH domain